MSVITRMMLVPRYFLLVCVVFGLFVVVSSLQPRAAMLTYLSTPLIDTHMASSSNTAAAAAAAISSSSFLLPAVDRPTLSISLRPVQNARLMSKLHHARGESVLQTHH